MPVRFLSDAELATLSGCPDEITAALITYFTLTSDDLGWPDGLTVCSLTAADRVATQLGLAGDDVPGMLQRTPGPVWQQRVRP